MAKAIFHPQAWIHDYAVDVDPEGATEWDVGMVPPDLRDNRHESDLLRFHENAPAWTRNWNGPFWIEVIR